MGKKSFVIIIGLMIFGLMLSGTAKELKSKQGATLSPRYGFDVEISRAEKSENDYVCKVIISDLETNSIIAVPRLTNPAGKKARMETKGKNETIVVTMLVGENKKTAVYTIDISASGKKMVSHKAKINL